MDLLKAIRSTPASRAISMNVPSPLFRKSCDGAFSFAMNRSRLPSLSISVHTAACEERSGLSSPLWTVTSVKVPSQLFRSRDLLRGYSHPPRNTKMSMQPSLLRSEEHTSELQSP